MVERTIRIGTRGSKLALTQTQALARELEALCPGLKTELVVIKTTGDQVLDRPLSEIGVKGIFTKELDAALRDGRADIAVHSLKDVPVVQPDDIVLAAVPVREDPRDAFIGKDARTLGQTTQGAQIGTSSLRRRAQLLAKRTDLTAVDLRGNIDTRLRKVQEVPELGGIILALAGVRRMGLVSSVSEVLELSDWLPAPGQGALAVTARAGDGEMLALAAKLEHADTRACVTAERALLARLEGGCHVPIGAHARVQDGILHLDGLVADPAGKRVLRAQHHGPVAAAAQIGEALAVTLCEQGGREILAALQNAASASTQKAHMTQNGANPPLNKGFVSLVGAGPGDPGLITVKGLRCVAEADVILYDLLSNPGLLSHARPDCELICSGKRAGKHSMKQEDINELLGQKALEGKRVCRLKGGDPFIFGRGGEEALHLRTLGVPFEVVPGVSSSIAAPAYAGIPVTHRECASSLRIITGHEDPTKAESSLDWREIAETHGTLVFLMGVRNLPLIAERLIAGGRAADTPAAVIASGTLPNQRTVVATLATIAQTVEQSGIEPPAVTVVGEVAGLREQLNWFENRPLFGRSILVTRARAQASEFSEALERLGAHVVQAPAIRIRNLADSPEMRRCVRELKGIDWVVFTSVNGVDAFLGALAYEELDVRALAGKKLAAIGPATADRLHASGLRPDLMPERFVAEALLDSFDGMGSVAGLSFLLPRTEIARPELAEGLRARGASVIEVAAYETLPEPELPEEALEQLADKGFDLVTFTSSSTVHNFVKAIPEAQRGEWLRRVKAASIGPITSATINEYGIPIAVTAEASTIPSLVDAIVAHFAQP